MVDARCEMRDAMNKNEGSNAEKKVTTMNHEYIYIHVKHVLQVHRHR